MERLEFSDLLARARLKYNGKEKEEGELPKLPVGEIRKGVQGETYKRGRRKREQRELTFQEVFETIQIPLLLRTPEFISEWSEWIEHRLEIGYAYKFYTSLGCFERAMRKCERWGIQRAIAAIDNSIALCYRGLYEPLYSSSLNQQPREQKIIPRL
jgi:hypothetical protein